MFRQLYKGKSVFVTGHTGFKGSTLALWLQTLGAQVRGYALDPERYPNHFDILGLDIEDERGDIRDFAKLKRALKKAKPEIIFHLAAQPLVRKSYATPLETWSTNVMGTANLLESAKEIDSLQAIVVVTTDKVYENKNETYAYKESDPLGGHDPYSASKAATELLTDSFRKSFFSSQGSPLIATARAGNVIGGGDFSEDRLIPDIVRGVDREMPALIRAPHAIRPWQHVFDALSGYLLLGQKLLERERACATSWNFGPETSDNRKVSEVLEELKKYWRKVNYKIAESNELHEANQLFLDSTKAKEQLSWQAVWPLSQALKKTAEWYSAWLEEGLSLTEEQLEAYIADATEKKVSYASYDDATKYITSWITNNKLEAEKR